MLLISLVCIPLLLLGSTLLPCGLFHRFDNKNTIDTIEASACLMGVSSWTSSIGQCTWYHTAKLRWQNCNGQQSWFISSLSLLFCLLLPWLQPGQHEASSRPMAASSGFRCSPGHAILGDVVCIAPLHRHGHCNGQQRRYIFLLSPPLLFDQIMAKRPCYGPFLN